MCLPATDMHGAPIRHRYRIIVGRLLDLYEQTRLFLSFPYVCPEPVLARRSFLAQMAQKDAFSYLPVPSSHSPSRAKGVHAVPVAKVGVARLCDKHDLLPQCPLRLSRAVLANDILF